MSKLVWDAATTHFYQTGCKHGVLYKQDSSGAYPAGVAWNGLTAVTVSPEGADATEIYADDIKYLTLRSAENIKATIEALYSPPEFDECDGSVELAAGMKIAQQARKAFGFAWETVKGNETELNDYGRILHILYGCTVAPSEKSYQTINDSPEVMNLSWEIDTVPAAVTGHKPTAYVEIDLTALSPAQVTAVENALFGADAQEATAATYKKATGTYQATGVDYYTRSGEGTTQSPYVYTKDDTPSSEEFDTYYVVDTPAHDAQTASSPYLPLPDALAGIITAAAA